MRFSDLLSWPLASFQPDDYMELGESWTLGSVWDEHTQTQHANKRQAIKVSKIKMVKHFLLLLLLKLILKLEVYKLNHEVSYCHLWLGWCVWTGQSAHVVRLYPDAWEILI